MRRRALLGGAVLLLVLAAIAVSAVRSALSAADDLRAARSELGAVRGAASATTQAEEELRRAQVLVRSADDTLSRWPVDVMAALPVVGRSWDIERAATDTADAVIAGALVLTDGLSGVRAQAGGVDVAALTRIRTQVQAPAERGRAALVRLRGAPAALTPPQVAQEKAEAVQALGPAVEALERAQSALALATGVFGGQEPRSLLVALQNNAELRGAGGYVSTFGTGRLENGRLALGPLQDVVAVADPPERARRVPAPSEYVEDYGPLSGDTTMWRSWNMSPHVPDSALVGARVAGALLGTEPDVVVLLDVPALGAIAALGGQSVPLPGGASVSPEELTDALLVDAYASAGAADAEQDRRRAQLRAAAGTAVSRLLAGELPASDVLSALVRLAQGRHLTVWSADPAEQQTLVDLGVAGSVEAPAGWDLSHVSLNNIGGNKLDLYADRRVSIDVRLGREAADVVQRVELTNRAPTGLVPYVEGVRFPGEMVNRFELSLPRTATEVSMTVDGAVRQEQPSAGAGRQRIAVRTQTPRGATTVVEVRYVLPLRDASYRLRLVPQPLVKDATVALTVRAADGVELKRPDGAELEGGAIREPAAPFTRTRELSVELR